MRQDNGQAGYTLIELLVAMSIAIVVIGGPLSFIVFTINQQNATSSRSYAARQASVGLAQFGRDLRRVVPGTTVTLTWGGAIPSSAVMTLPYPATEGASTEQVTWTCTSGRSCARRWTCSSSCGGLTVGGASNPIANVVLMTFAPVDASNSAIASGVAANPVYVGVTLQVQDSSQLDSAHTQAVAGIANPITISDGIDLRGNSA